MEKIFQILNKPRFQFAICNNSSSVNVNNLNILTLHPSVWCNFFRPSSSELHQQTRKVSTLPVPCNDHNSHLDHLLLYQGMYQGKAFCNTNHTIPLIHLSKVSYYRTKLQSKPNGVPQGGGSNRYSLFT